jgi:Acetyltransferase (GNAT) domain
MLPRSGGSVLVRAIENADLVDGVGPYPLFACGDWEGLGEDVAELAPDLVSVVLVTDPFGSWRPAGLERAFPDLCRPFKEHFVADLSRPFPERTSKHHRRDLARALRRTEVEVAADPRPYLSEWVDLYRELCSRHDVGGDAAFSERSFAKQFELPGLTLVRATSGAELDGAALWLVDGPVAYYHLAAYTAAGYRSGASYALVGAALYHFAGKGLEWATLGAGAGLGEGDDDGLTRFKAGWASGTRPVYLCGRVLDRRRYDDLAAERGGDPAYFPAYRFPTTVTA